MLAILVVIGTKYACNLDFLNSFLYETIAGIFSPYLDRYCRHNRSPRYIQTHSKSAKFISKRNKKYRYKQLLKQIQPRRRKTENFIDSFRVVYHHCRIQDQIDECPRIQPIWRIFLVHQIAILHRFAIKVRFRRDL